MTSTTAKAVYAHFIGGNAAGMSTADWAVDINMAKQAHIDGFAINIAALDPNTSSILANAYAAAQSVGGFALFLSFDYNSWGTWAAADIITYINGYKDSPAQARYAGKPLASTFEGPGNAGDWHRIKAETGCFFVPDWTSLGPGGFSSHLGVADGAFSWNAWPDGASDMTTVPDSAWKSVLGSKPYMMPVSPWFYTNLPQWGKNWLWRGDDMWHHRWQQVIQMQPELVQIISWNDYGESHYLGPVRASGVPAGAWYVDGMDHTGWLAMLPHYIDMYKYGAPPPSNLDKISFWYKTNPSLSGSAEGTAGNNPSYQAVVAPDLVVQDKVFIDVLTSAAASEVIVNIGGAVTTLHCATAGIHHFSVPLRGMTGAVAVSIVRRGGNIVKTAKGTSPVTNTCANGRVNWNALTGSA